MNEEKKESLAVPIEKEIDEAYLSKTDLKTILKDLKPRGTYDECTEYGQGAWDACEQLVMWVEDHIKHKQSLTLTTGSENRESPLALDRDEVVRQINRAFVAHCDDHPLDSMLRDGSGESIVRWTANKTFELLNRESPSQINEDGSDKPGPMKVKQGTSVCGHGTPTDQPCAHCLMDAVDRVEGRKLNRESPLIGFDADRVRKYAEEQKLQGALNAFSKPFIEDLRVSMVQGYAWGLYQCGQYLANYINQHAQRPPTPARKESE